MIFNPTSINSLCAAGMLSPSGRCQALSDSADGYVRGESAICLLLKGNEAGASAAEHAASAATCILVGSAVNQDGRSSSLTAPNGKSQEDVISSAWRKADLLPSSMSTLGLHGTGTALGDPIEVGAAAACLKGEDAAGDQSAVFLQANKSNVGHGEAVAGISALQYAIQSLTWQSAKAILHIQGVNPHVQTVANQLQRDSGSSICMPRAGSVIPSAGKYSMNAGISSFAYQVQLPPPCCLTGVQDQCRRRHILGLAGGHLTRRHLICALQGTNAHACIQAKRGSMALPNTSCVLWDRHRHWVPSLKGFQLLSQAFAKTSNKKAAIIFHGPLATPSSSCFWDHQVTIRMRDKQIMQRLASSCI